jgi:hypothetical protein
MNAGRDVERLISSWLADEAEVRAPNRVLESARRSIDRTPQRRFLAAWREAVNLSPLRLTTLAAAFVVAVIAGAYLGRLTAPPGAGSQPTASPTAAAPTAGVTVDTYRAARNAICNRYRTSVDPLKEQLAGIFDVETSAADRSAKAQTLLDIVGQLEAMVFELSRLDAPTDLGGPHAAYVTRYQDINLLIREVLTRLAAGDIEGAATVDESINTLNTPMLAFEGDNGLDNCP